MNGSDIDIVLTYYDDKDLTQLLPAIVFLLLLILVGTPGNIIVLYVYKTRFKPSPLRCFILAMALLDLGICIFDIPLEIIDVRYKYTFGRHFVLCKIFHFIHDFLAIMSMYMLIAIAVERFRKVCRPLGKQMDIKVAQITCASCCFVSLVLSVQAVFKYGLKSTELGFGNGTIVLGTECSTANNHSQTLVVVNFGFWIAQDIGVFLVLGVLYSIIWQKVRDQHTYRRSVRTSVSRKSRDDRTGCERDKSLPANVSKDGVCLPRGDSWKDGNLARVQNSIQYSPSGSVRTNQLTSKPSSSNLSSHGRKMTMVMFVVTLVCFFAYLPVVCKMLIKLFYSEAIGNFKRKVLWFYYIFGRSYYIQCVSNPVIYSVWNTSFRCEVVRIWKRKLGRQPSP